MDTYFISHSFHVSQIVGCIDGCSVLTCQQQTSLVTQATFMKIAFFKYLSLTTVQIYEKFHAEFKLSMFLQNLVEQ